MSDYGFVTYDAKTGKRLDASINSKWPIFGPEYGDIKQAFRTIHFTDTKQYAYRTDPSVVLPTDQYGISQFHGYEKILVATIPHGYKKRPLGYATISGSYVKNTRSRWAYTKVVDYWGDFPPSATLEAVDVKSGYMTAQPGTGLSPTMSQGIVNDFNYNYFGLGITYPALPDTWLYYPTPIIPGNNSASEDAVAQERIPYSVEIDDTNVYIYRYYYWCDIYKREYMVYQGTTRTDVRARMSGIIDYAGSSFDVTIYLCPYSMEDLV